MDFVFVACVDLDDQYSGISRKVYSEYNALQNAFDGCLIGYAGNGVKIVHGCEEVNIQNRKKHRRLVVIDESIKMLEKNFRFLYIRRMPCNPIIISFLSKIKRKGVLKIVWEIPTYPYDHEHNNSKSLYGWITDKMDIIFRGFLKNYIDRIVTFSDYTEIFKIQTINTGNGIDVNSVKPRVISDDDNGSLNLIAVAVLNNWHGYDRLIRGISDYYENGGKRNVIFHLVGDGECLQEYKDLVKKLHIENNVIFYGFKTTKEIDKIYDKCNLAVDSLGWHRSKVSLGTSLKSREYLAKGLPIIASTPMDIFPDGWEYAFYAPIDDSSININDVISFYDNIHQNIGEAELSVKIRNIAYEKCDMSAMMKPVIDYLEGESGCANNE